MKKTLMTSLVLFLICAVCAVLCATVNSFTAPKIEENIRKANAEALKSVAGDLEIGETVPVEGWPGVVEATPLLEGFWLGLQPYFSSSSFMKTHLNFR